jgi:hypothetical protein
MLALTAAGSTENSAIQPDFVCQSTVRDLLTKLHRPALLPFIP